MIIWALNSDGKRDLKRNGLDSQFSRGGWQRKSRHQARQQNDQKEDCIENRSTETLLVRRKGKLGGGGFMGGSRGTAVARRKNKETRTKATGGSEGSRVQGGT